MHHNLRTRPMMRWHRETAAAAPRAAPSLADWQRRAPCGLPTSGCSWSDAAPAPPPQAEALGCTADVPLAIPMAQMAIKAELAAGAEATVWQGEYCGAPVAIKRFKIAQQDDLSRFRRELALMASIRHPRIMPLVGARALPPHYCTVMPLAATNLHHKLYEQGWQPGWGEVLRIGADIAEALEHVHAQGVVHRWVGGWGADGRSCVHAGLRAALVCAGRRRRAVVSVGSSHGSHAQRAPPPPPPLQGRQAG
jgi:hypothetical protein